MKVVNRTGSPHCGCPYCSGESVLAGETDIATTDPDLLEIWDYDKNKILPTKVSRSSDKIIWWKCYFGHSYDSLIKVKTRVSKVTGYRQGIVCPICTNKRLLKGYNDFESRYPELIKEWDFNRHTIKPDELLYGSNKRVCRGIL